MAGGGMQGGSGQSGQGNALSSLLQQLNSAGAGGWQPGGTFQPMAQLPPNPMPSVARPMMPPQPMMPNVPGMPVAGAQVPGMSGVPGGGMMGAAMGGPVQASLPWQALLSRRGLM